MFSRLFVGTTSNHPVGFYANNAELATLTTAGRFGVGTSAPAVNFEVSSAGLTAARVNRGTSGAGQRLDVFVASDGLSTGIESYSDALAASLPLSINSAGGRVDIGSGGLRLNSGFTATKFTVSSASPGALAQGEVYFQY